MWCGPGSVNGCCPGDSTDNGCKKKLKDTYGYDNYDMAADFVCRRHDSGGYSHPVDVFGTTIPRAPCNMDRDIAEGIQNDNAGGTPW